MPSSRLNIDDAVHSYFTQTHPMSLLSQRLSLSNMRATQRTRLFSIMHPWHTTTTCSLALLYVALITFCSSPPSLTIIRHVVYLITCLPSNTGMLLSRKPANHFPSPPIHPPYPNTSSNRSLPPSPPSLPSAPPSSPPRPPCSAPASSGSCASTRP